MKNKVCSCFGHREIYHNIDSIYSKLENIIINENVNVFMTGGMGEFDELFSSTIRQLKIKYPNIKLLLIAPYFTQKINLNKEYLQTMYDEIIIPDCVINSHYKSAISVRNRWMVENSDIILSYIHRNFGGAFTAVKYAVRLNKKVINLYNQIIN